jgi:hypothetical protein
VKTSNSRHLAAALCWGVLYLPTLCPAQKITDLNITTDPDSLLKSLEITVDVPPLSIVQLQGNPLLSRSRLGRSDWQHQRICRGETTFATPLAGQRGFFRFKTTPIPFSGTRTGFIPIQCRSWDHASAVHRLDAIPDEVARVSAGHGYQPVPRTGRLTIPPGDHSVPNPTLLGDALGLGLWVPGSPEDDGKFAETYRPTDSPQDGKEIPTPGGDQPMGPWQDNIREEVPAGANRRTGRVRDALQAGNR